MAARFSHTALVFHGRHLPEEATVVGYAAIIHTLNLPVPMPATISIISKHNKKYQKDGWALYPAAYRPLETETDTEATLLYRHLVFALKYESINLLLFKKLLQHYDAAFINELICIEPTGQYARRIWFLLEWLSGTTFTVRDNLVKKSYIKLVDEELQFAVEGVKSPRHLVINNLPGTVDMCPMVYKTPVLQQYMQQQVAAKQHLYLQGFRKEVLQRAAAFLLLKDSRASFTIEGESPKSKRAQRWGQAIGQAGLRDLSEEELLRLQQLVIESTRFVQMGYRQQGGFVGEHDSVTGEPLPDHISARWQDLEQLMNGWLQTVRLLCNDNMDAVVSAAMIAFGFVFIHPFEDGNGRLHRYIIHHILAKKNFTQEGIIFPVSAAMLNEITRYRKVLEAYSLPLLDFIEWKETDRHNVEVLNDTIDYYRYFDATPQAEFLYHCVQQTAEHIIPQEVNYLLQYDAFKKIMEETYEMPDKTISLLLRFLQQHNGSLSKRAREKEFEQLTDEEATHIEQTFKNIFAHEQTT